MHRSSTMSESRPRQALLVLALGGLLAGLLLSGGLDRWRQGNSHGVPNLGVDGEVTLPNSEAFSFATLPEMVATAHTVVLGTVDSERRGAIEDDTEVRITQRLLHVQVEKTWPAGGRNPAS
jgi:hypothetical protein